MEKHYKTNWLSPLYRGLMLSVALLFASTMAMAQLSGAYTIDKGTSTGGKNFASFTDFSSALTSSGLSGAVTVTVKAGSGPYLESVTFGNLSSSSSTNTVTINGNGEIIRNTSSSVGSVILMDGADFFTFNNLKIDAANNITGTRCMTFMNSANNNTVKGCDLMMTANSATGNSTAYIAFTGSTTSSTTSAAHGSNNVIDGNKMSSNGVSGVGPYYGIVDYRSSSFASTVGNNQYLNNDIRDIFYYGIYTYYTNGMTITGNKVHDQRSSATTIFAYYNYYSYTTTVANTFEKNEAYNLTPSSTLYAFYTYYWSGTTTLTTKLNGNSFYNSKASNIYGNIFSYSNYSEAKDNQTYGNAATGYLYYGGIYAQYNQNCLISGNIMRNNSASSYVYNSFYIYYCTNTKVEKNQMYSNSSSNYIYYSFYLYYCTNVDFVDNQFYSNSSSNYMYYIVYAYFGSGIKVNGTQIYSNTATYMYYPFYIYYVTNIDVMYNDVYSNSATYMYGYYTYYNTNFRLEENTFHDNKADYFYYGFMFYYANNGTMLNNMYYNNDCGGYNYYTLYNGYGTNNTIAHNTFILDDNLSYNYYTWYIYYYNTPVNIKIHNNILYFKGSTSGGYPIYCYYNVDQISWANNVVWDASSGTKYWYAGSSTYNTFTQWAAVAGDKTSMEVDPMIPNYNKGDLTPTNPIISNIGTQGLAKIDWNQKTRTACGPDPGAIEFTVDHSASNFTFKGTNECGGYMEKVTFDFQSGVNVAMKNVKVFYTINGKDQVTEVIPNVAANGKVTFTFTKLAEFHEPGNNVIEVGLLCDDNTTNNTIKKTIFITPAPHSFELSEGAKYPGYYQAGASGGTFKNPDVTATDLEVEYNVVNPAKYANSTYNSGWRLTPTLYTAGGKVVTSGFTFTAPGSAAGKLAFKPASSLVDSTVFVGFTARDINTGCDSTFGRWIYIPPTPIVDWSVIDGCDGDVISFTNKTTQAKGLVEYAWNFGDPKSGEDSASTISDPVHKFSTFGTYKVTVNAWNFTYPKFVYSLTKNVSISPVPTVCYKITNACEGNFIKFTNCTTSPVSGTIDYSWNFGDGTAKSTAKDPQHKYNKAGGFPVTLTASLKGCVATLTKNANQFATPKADFSFSGKCNLEEIEFTNGTTIALGNTGYKWDFGDGSVSNVANPSHPFATAGSQTVKLKAVSEFGCENEITKTLVLNESPKADFTYTDACNLKAVDFKRTGTLPAGSNSIYQWDFDGEKVSTNENPSHLFSTIGVKKVSLLVSSTNGCADMITKEFVVKLQAKADFVATNVCEGEEVVFTNKSTVSSGNLNYTWRFGDGENANITSPRHSYVLQNSAETESFNVTLVAIVPGGCSDSIARSVTVNATSNASFDASTKWRNLVISNQKETDPSNIYNWRFGDGGRSTAVTPTYEYVNVDKGEFEVCLNIINNAGCASEHCEMVTIDLKSSGINEISNNMFSVYPNPNRGLFNVKVNNVIGDVQIVVMDAAGKTIRTINANDASGIYGVDMSDVATGVYLVKVTNGSASAIERVTITK